MSISVKLKEIAAEIEKLEIAQIDTELEEAKKRFPAGSWFNHKDYGSCLFLVRAVRRIYGDVNVVSDSNQRFYATSCTPATLPTRAIKWRCMKTDAPDTARTVLINLDGKYYSAYHSKRSIWYVEGFSINVSNYTSALWCELSEIEGE